MKSQTNVLRASLLVAVTLLLATGCAVANPFAPSNASARQSTEQLALKWAQCMRQHGVDVTDPDSKGGVTIQASGTASGPGAKGSPDQGPPSEVQAAMNACKQYQPNGGQASRPPNQQQLDAAIKFAQCMRDHGIPMQDPQVQNGGVAIVGNPDTGVDPSSDQFKQAHQACQHYLPDGGRGASTTTKNG